MTHPRNPSRRDFLAASAIGLFGLARGPERPPDGDLLYVGTYTAGTRSEGIYLLRMDRRSGELRQMGSVDAGPNPSFLGTHPNGRFLYAVNELERYNGRPTGAVSAFAIVRDTGALTRLNEQPSGGGAPCFVSVDRTGRVALVANYAGGSVALLPIEGNGATKANIRALLRLLTDGGPVPPELQTIANADKLKAVTPNDVVLILFAGHGFTGTNGLFYLVPYDTGSGRGRGITPQLQQHSISNDELSLWLRKLDAGRIAFIVDACHSAGAVESTEFKPGPMGSRGLGQLAYDKGMLILAATQVDRAAYEGTRLRQGFLTYALVKEGLEEAQADFDPADGTITLREWLNYGVVGVPHLFDNIVAGKAVPFRDVSVDEATHIRTDQQQPSLFDFARRGIDVTIVNGRTNH